MRLPAALGLPSWCRRGGEWRFPLLLLLGVVAVVVQPTREMVAALGRVCVAVTLVDLAVAVSPRRLDIQREPVGQVRLGRRRPPRC